MSYFINYQKILDRIEKKNQARSKKRSFKPDPEIFMLEGGRLTIYEPGTLYLESAKSDSSLYN